MVTTSRFNCLVYKTRNLWHSTDAYFRLAQWLCRFLWCIYGLPIHWFLTTAFKLPANYLTYITKNCWYSIDAHLQNVALTVLAALLAIKDANTLVMHNSKQITVQLPYLQDVKSLTLHWHSYGECVIDCVAFSFAYRGCQYVAYA